MFIKTDNDNNIIGLISVGTKPTENGYEISNDTPEEIVQNIFDYRYIDGEFVKKDNVDAERLQKIKDVKIANMSNTCNSVIEAGIDYNGEHYSLQQTDQINLMKLESVAMTQPDAIIFYHADGRLCRQYTAEEIIAIAQISVQYITYHTTYFNFMKSQINSMTSIDEIIAMNYGSKLVDAYQSQLDAFSTNLPFTMEEIVDDYNYNRLLIDIDVDSLIIKDMTPTVDELTPAEDAVDEFDPDKDNPVDEVVVEMNDNMTEESNNNNDSDVVNEDGELVDETEEGNVE